jgi:hypothetical protein
MINRKLLSQIRSLENIKNVHEMFQKQIQETDDSFSVISNYFSQGIFNKVTLVTDEGVLQSANSMTRPKSLNLMQK